LEINASVTAGRLEIIWTFNSGIHRQKTIDNLAQAFLHSLRSLIAHCLSANAGGYTPSDFSKARLTQASLDRLVARVKKSGKKELT
jgi:non-ribosomal peptide synthase protein (TIGR01720 family)